MRARVRRMNMRRGASAERREEAKFSSGTHIDYKPCPSDSRCPSPTNPLPSHGSPRLAISCPPLINMQGQGGWSIKTPRAITRRPNAPIHWTGLILADTTRRMREDEVSRYVPDISSPLSLRVNMIFRCEEPFLATHSRKKVWVGKVACVVRVSPRHCADFLTAAAPSKCQFPLPIKSVGGEPFYRPQFPADRLIFSSGYRGIS